MPDPGFDMIVNLAKKRGFVFQASEIYGGLRSAYDYGPLGVALLRNVKEAWWRSMVRSRDDVVGIDSAIIQSPRVWEASGHVTQFHDPLVECTSCHARHRPDKLADPLRCPTCGLRESFTEARDFNLMFRTHMGPVAGEGTLVYLRPETAQGIFTNFENVRRVMRRKLPFGIAQIGKSFRNEITPGQFVFRTPRVRADGDGVLHPPGRCRPLVRLLGRSAPGLVPGSGYTARQPPVEVPS